MTTETQIEDKMLEIIEDELKAELGDALRIWHLDGVSIYYPAVDEIRLIYDCPGIKKIVRVFVFKEQYGYSIRVFAGDKSDDTVTMCYMFATGASIFELEDGRTSSRATVVISNMVRSIVGLLQWFKLTGEDKCKTN